MRLLSRKKKEERSAGDRALLEELFDTQAQLDAIRSRFEYVTEPEMVSSCIFEMRSVQEKYSYLLGRIRAKEICLRDRSEILWKE